MLQIRPRGSLPRMLAPDVEPVIEYAVCIGFAGLRMVIRIEPHVLGREVGRPEPSGRLAFFENEDDARVAIGGDRFGDGVARRNRPVRLARRASRPLI